MNALRARGSMSAVWLLLIGLVVLILGVSGSLRADDKEKDKKKDKKEDKKETPPPTTLARPKSTQPPAPAEKPDRDKNRDRGGSETTKTDRNSSADRDRNRDRDKDRDKAEPQTTKTDRNSADRDKDRERDRNRDKAEPQTTKTDRNSSADRDKDRERDKNRDKVEPETTKTDRHPSSDRDRDRGASDTAKSGPKGTHGPSDAAGSAPATKPPKRASEHTWKPGEVLHGSNNTEAKVGADGRIAVVRSPGVTIQHSSVGARRVIVERPDKTVIVVHDRGRGYVQRPFTVRNETFVQRTYYQDHNAYVRLYRPYRYHGVILNAYVPVRYYSPGFYGWAYSPWATPVSYRWGWYDSSWYGYYGGYFVPYTSYPSASFWLTDYLVSSTLEAAYREGVEAGYARYAEAGDSEGPGLTPEVKRLISDEVQRQLDLEREEAQGLPAGSGEGLPPMLGGGTPRVFVVGRSLDVANLSDRGRECVISEGDVLQTRGGFATNGDATDVVVLASRRHDCRVGNTVSVPLEELLEMQNQLRDRLDTGLETLRSRGGHDGLPSLPSSARSVAVPASYAAALPPADPNVATEIDREMQQANRTERDVLGDAADEPESDNNAPTTISRGQTINQVTALLGPPKKIVDLGSKKIYIYEDMKVTFLSGVVSDVE